MIMLNLPNNKVFCSIPALFETGDLIKIFEFLEVAKPVVKLGNYQFS